MTFFLCMLAVSEGEISYATTITCSFKSLRVFSCAHIRFFKILLPTSSMSLVLSFRYSSFIFEKTFIYLSMTFENMYSTHLRSFLFFFFFYLPPPPSLHPFPAAWGGRVVESSSRAPPPGKEKNNPPHPPSS